MKQKPKIFKKCSTAWILINFISRPIQDQNPYQNEIDPKHWSLYLLWLLLLLLLFTFISRIIMKGLSETDLEWEVVELPTAGSIPESLIQILIYCFQIH